MVITQIYYHGINFKTIYYSVSKTHSLSNERLERASKQVGKRKVVIKGDIRMLPNG